MLSEQTTSMLSVTFISVSGVPGLKKWSRHTFENARTTRLSTCFRRRLTVHSVAQSPRPVQSTTSTGTDTQRVSFARGETFSRRRIGMYELTREGVDPSVLLKRSYKFELIYGAVLISFTSIFFIIPVITHRAVREDWVAGFIAVVMSLYAVDTLALSGAVQSTIFAAFSDRNRVARHEAAHLLVAHLLGFRVSGAKLPTPRNVWESKRGQSQQPGVAIERCFAQDDPHRVAATGLAGFAAELLTFNSAFGAEDDMAQVSRRVRAFTKDDGKRLSDEEVKHVIRWGLLVATRVVKQHSEAYEAVVKALLDGKDVNECIAIIDRYANEEHLVSEAFGS